MKILRIDKKENEIICVPENLDDLWHLEKILNRNDIIYGTTDRKIKPTKDGEKTIRQKLFIELQVIDAHFQEFSENLRVNGIILSGKPEELIQIKSHHSLELFVGEKIRIKKNELKQWQIERLKKAEKTSTTTKLLVVLLDDEEAELAFINQYSINKKAIIKEKKRGKLFEQEKSNYFDQILEKIIGLEPKKILLAGPGFVKENLKKFIENKRIRNFPQIMVETTNSIGEPGFRELLNQGKLNQIEKQLQLTKESEVIEEFLSALGKGKAEYGKEKVLDTIKIGAIGKLIIAETYLMQNRDEAEEILNLAEEQKCEFEIISSRNPQEKNIMGFGGIVAILRYKIE